MVGRWCVGNGGRGTICLLHLSDHSSLCLSFSSLLFIPFLLPSILTHPVLHSFPSNHSLCSLSLIRPNSCSPLSSPAINLTLLFFSSLIRTVIHSSLGTSQVLIRSLFSYHVLLGYMLLYLFSLHYLHCVDSLCVFISV